MLLDFWATWCAPCVAELPNLKKLRQEFPQATVEIVSISFDRDAIVARRYAAENSLNWTHIWAERADKGTLAELYGVSAIPATILIGPDGVVIARDLRGDELMQAVRRAQPK